MLKWLIWIHARKSWLVGVSQDGGATQLLAVLQGLAACLWYLMVFWNFSEGQDGFLVDFSNLKFSVAFRLKHSTQATSLCDCGTGDCQPIIGILPSRFSTEIFELRSTNKSRQLSREESSTKPQPIRDSHEPLLKIQTEFIVEITRIPRAKSIFINGS